MQLTLPTKLKETLDNWYKTCHALLSECSAVKKQHTKKIEKMRTLRWMSDNIFKVHLKINNILGKFGVDQ